MVELAEPNPGIGTNYFLWYEEILNEILVQESVLVSSVN